MHKNYSNQLPGFEQIFHLPWKPNTSRGDLVVPQELADTILNNPLATVQEKVDGSFCAMALIDDHPVIRNREHIFRKGYRKETPAKMQFAKVWTWFYDNKDKFEDLAHAVGQPVSVYGEWMVQQHGMIYDKLPDWFIAFDLYLQEERKFLDPILATGFLRNAGFETTPVLGPGPETWEELEMLANGKTPFAKDARREGVVVKISKQGFRTHIFKMVRQGFVQGGLFEEGILKVNQLYES